jgi:hypothetical protein
MPRTSRFLAGLACGRRGPLRRDAGTGESTDTTGGRGFPDRAVPVAPEGFLREAMVDADTTDRPDFWPFDGES